jgi:hypothetical protein
MDEAPISYHCLPLKIANAHGWQVLNEKKFYAAWDGTADRLGVVVHPQDSYINGLLLGHGLLTLPLRIFFRTDPGWDLFVTAPINNPKDGIVPLTAVIETNWFPFQFFLTMKFTCPYKAVCFEEGEPIAQVFPIPHGYLDKIEPKSRALADDPELEQQWRAWWDNRTEHRLRAQDPRDQSIDYIKSSPALYRRGIYADGTPASSDHRTSLRLKEFELEFSASWANQPPPAATQPSSKP